MAERGSRITEDEARQLWQRAAELQVAADRDRPAAGSLEPANDDAFSLAQVAAAAEGAGIDADFVRLALAERRLPDADSIRRDRWAARWLRRVVAETDAIALTRRIASPPARVLEVLGTVDGRTPFQLVLENRLGEDPLRDGVLVCRVSGHTMSSQFVATMEFGDVRVLLVTLRRDADGTLLHLRAPLLRRGLNLAITGVSTGLGGGGSIAK